MENLIDKKYGRLTVRAFSHKRGHKSYWWCECKCGNMKQVRSDSLKSGTIQSCGCLKSEQDKVNLSQLGHGDARKGKVSKEYTTWQSMLQRCYCTTNERYQDWGGRGIKVCDRWHEFANFLADMGRRPTPKHSLNRIDNDKDYCPDNCEWTTNIVQSRNRRSNVFLTHNAITKTAKEWSVELNINLATILNRKKLGKPDHLCLYVGRLPRT